MNKRRLLIRYTPPDKGNVQFRIAYQSHRNSDFAPIDSEFSGNGFVYKTVKLWSRAHPQVSTTSNCTVEVFLQGTSVSRDDRPMLMHERYFYKFLEAVAAYNNEYSKNTVEVEDIAACITKGDL